MFSRRKKCFDMEALKIDLNDYVHSGEGANGESYFHKTDPGLMLKLYFAGANIRNVVSEHEIAQKVYEAGIATPRPGEFITDGNGRYGIRFERLADKVSFSRAVANEPDRVEELARRFARMSMELHSTKLDTTKFESMKERDLRDLHDSPFFTEDERRRTEKFLLEIPEIDTALHGDLQYSNALITPKGDYFIDLGDFAYGHPYFDLGQVYLSCCFSPDEFIRETFHLEPATAREFWRFFVMEYFGEDVSFKEVCETIRPYSGLMTLLIDRAMNTRMDIFHALLPR